MRPAASAIVDHLVWTTSGSVWAYYTVDPLPWAHRSDDERLSVRHTIRSLLLGLPERAVLWGLHEQLDPAEVVGSMVDGVDLDTHPGWAAACGETLDGLAGCRLLRRLYLVGFRLPDTNRSRLAAAVGAASGSVEGAFGLPPRRPSRRDVEIRRRQAAAVVARLGNLELTPASTGRLRWLHARACRRGLAEPVFDPTWEPTATGEASGGSLVRLLDADFVEGGLADDVDRPRRARYVRVESEFGVSFQTFLCVAAMPAEFSFPGGAGEWWRELEEVPWPVEWCLRLRSVDNQQAQRKVRRQHRQLIAQVDEYDGEVTGAPESLAKAIDGIRAEGADLDANRAEREGQGTVVFALGADNLAELEDRAGALTAMFEPLDYGLGRPTGGQSDLFTAFLPGAGSPRVCRDYTQFMLSGSWAAGAPFTANPVGDPTGMLLGASVDAGIETPVLFDPAFGPAIGRSASIGVCGGLGGGKSYLAKRILWATVARGGQAVTVDRTQRGEYVALGAVIPGRTQVVELGATSDVCLDPMRIFATPAEREAVTLGFLTLLTGYGTQTVKGDILAEVAATVAARPDSHLADVIAELDGLVRRGDEPEAREIARRVRSQATRPGVQVAFGDGDRLWLDADFIVFHAAGLVLPDRDHMVQPQLRDQLPPEQIVNLALLYLVAAVQRHVCFADPSRFAVANFDEAHYLTASPQGEQLLTELVRDGRKHNAAASIQSQAPQDFPQRLTELLGPRFAFRQFGAAAEMAQRFMGLEPAAELTDKLSDETAMVSGRCLFRDVRGRLAMIQVATDPLAEVHAALETNPARPAGTAPRGHHAVDAPAAPIVFGHEPHLRQRTKGDAVAVGDRAGP
jgi:hypothetical protein